MEIREKVAVVSGGGLGIGRAVARRLAHEGAAVVVADVDEEAGSGAVLEIHTEGGRAALKQSSVLWTCSSITRAVSRSPACPRVNSNSGDADIAGAVVMFVEEDSMAGRVMDDLAGGRTLVLVPLDAPY